MADVAITTAAEPDGAPRIAVLDILRGIAILGILFMNINDMGQSIFASFSDMRHLGWSASDQAAWWLREVFANGTARCMLELLFGAGMVILTGRVAEQAGEWTVMRRYYVRNLILFAFGLVHIFILLWPGDILHTYGLAALVAFLFRQLQPRWLVLLGLSLAIFMLVGGATEYNEIVTTRAEVARIATRTEAGEGISVAERKLVKAQRDAATQRIATRAESRRKIADEDDARSGTFVSWTKAQWHAIVAIELKGWEVFLVWEAASVMLMGAALFKLGILQGQRSRGFYLGMMLIAYALGIGLRIWGGIAQLAPPDSGPYFAGAMYEVARQTMTFGHIAAVNLLLTTGVGTVLLRPFVAAGRTALSIYVAQTLICLWVLYPPFVLGLYGKMTWGPLMVTALVVNLFLLVGANLWVRRFDIAPVEWAWRSLVERRMLPWHKRRPVPHVPAGGPLPA